MTHHYPQILSGEEAKESFDCESVVTGTASKEDSWLGHGVERRDDPETVSPVSLTTNPDQMRHTDRGQTHGRFLRSDIAQAGEEVAGCSARDSSEPGKAGEAGSTPVGSTTFSTADQMRRENQESFNRLSHLLDLYRMGAYELAKCRYCEKTVPITDINTKGICTGCEMEGK